MSRPTPEPQRLAEGGATPAEQAAGELLRAGEPWAGGDDLARERVWRQVAKQLPGTQPAPSRRWVFALAGAAALVVAGVAVRALWPAGAVARVELTAGPVLAAQPSGSWNGAEAGAVLPERSRIKTGARAQALMRLERAAVLASPDSDVGLESLGATTFLRLSGGAVVCEVEPRKPGEPFVVQTTRYRVTVKGTVFSVRERAPDDVRVSVSRGLVEVTGEGGTWLVAAGRAWESRQPSALEADDITARERGLLESAQRPGPRASLRVEGTGADYISEGGEALGPAPVTWSAPVGRYHFVASSPSGRLEADATAEAGGVATVKLAPAGGAVALAGGEAADDTSGGTPPEAPGSVRGGAAPPAAAGEPGVEPAPEGQPEPQAAARAEPAPEEPAPGRHAAVPPRLRSTKSHAKHTAKAVREEPVAKAVPEPGAPGLPDALSHALPPAAAADARHPSHAGNEPARPFEDARSPSRGASDSVRASDDARSPSRGASDSARTSDDVRSTSHGAPEPARPTADLRTTGAPSPHDRAQTNDARPASRDETPAIPSAPRDAPAPAAPPAAPSAPLAAPPLPSADPYADAVQLSRSGRWAEAAAAFQTVADAHAAHADLALYELGRLEQQRLGHPERALSAYLRYQREFPQGGLIQEVELSTIELLLQRRQLAQALEQLNHFLDAHGDSERAPEVHLLRGDVLREQGQCKPALDDYEQATSPAQADDALYFTAWCQQRLGRRDAAAATFGRYLERFPKGRHATQAAAALSHP